LALVPTQLHRLDRHNAKVKGLAQGKVMTVVNHRYVARRHELFLFTQLCGNPLHLQRRRANPSMKRKRNDGPKLKRFKLGNTDMECSVLGLGGAALGGVFGDVEFEECIATVHEAVLEHGINFIDTSPYYGNSEVMLGHCLKGLPRDSYYLATKCGRYGDDEFDFSAPRMEKSVKESIAQLGVQYLDLIQLHDIEFADISQLVNETLPALAVLKEQGLVRYIGISSCEFLRVCVCGFSSHAYSSLARALSLSLSLSLFLLPL
jgi:hypothetical protein